VDKTGRLWIGTLGGGLNSFNPETEKFTRYRIDSNNQGSSTGNSITSIYEDKSGLLWFCIQGRGLYSLDPATNEVHHYSQNPSAPNSLNYNDALRISGTYEDGKEYIWICTWGSGIYKFDIQRSQWTHYRHDPQEPNSLCDNYIEHIYTDHWGNLWLSSSWNGLDRLDTKTGRFTNYRHDPADPNSLCDNTIDAVWEKDGVLWITTMNGLSRLDIETNEFKSFFHQASDPTSIGQNDLWTIYESKSGLLWMGGWSGLDIIDFDQKPFATYRQQIGNSNSLSDNFACTILANRLEENDVLWIGTKDGGLNKINRRTGKYSHYRHDPADPNSLSDDFVFSITECSYKGKKILWLGTMAGLNRFDPQTETFSHFRHNPADTSSISEDIIHKVYADRKGSIWIGTRMQGLCRFDPLTGKTRRYHHELDETWAILEDSSGFIWHGTVKNGLYKLDPVSDKLTQYVHNPDNPQSISSNTIRSIHESFFKESHVLWIGTNAGLDRFDYQTEQFTHFTRKNGLPNEEIGGILEDKQGNLWLGTGFGLSKLDPHTGRVRNYDLYDGLQGNQFVRGGAFRSTNGEMFFGGTNGFTSFFPEQIKDNPHIPDIVLTDFQLFNKSVPIKQDSVVTADDYFLPKHISALSQIVLSYNQRVFSFEFTALDFRKPQKNRYAYKMEGVDPEWVYTDASRRFATYTNLDPGEYTFRVKGSNNDGIWNEAGISIKVIITPPWWQTRAAFIFYFVFFIALVAGLWRFQTGRLKMKQAMEMEHFESQKLRDVDRMKSRFFADISHEFRTPLTLIEGPVRQMLSGEFKGNLKEQYRMILRNSGRLLTLISQLLDLSKLESGKLKLKVRNIEIISFTNGLVQVFESMAKREDIRLTLDAGISAQEVYLDVEKYETIINNLLSNAFKATPPGGEIVISLDTPPVSPLMHKGGIKGGVEISVSNTGPVIPPDQIDHIFDRFYHAENSYQKDAQGTGIGLALTKELVELHHGTISVESDADAGTIFTLFVPLGKEHLKEDEIIEEVGTAGLIPGTGKEIVPDGSAEEDKRYKISDTRELTDSKNQSAVSGLNFPRLLIVEDNADLRQYIIQHMDHHFSIFEAENGQDGLNTALKEMPDLIISDVMMPVMDGYAFCEKIKSDERTSHIPVILLTAKADSDSRVEGLELGADDYIAKPFDNRELAARVNNLIDQRRMLREKFSRMIEVRPGEITASSKDEQFLTRLISVFEPHVDESDFSTRDFAREVGMSRSNLHRKLIALTNQPTHEFLRSLRLKRAAQLLIQAAGSVTEIAYAVGFTNPSHFSKIFREHFGQTPSQFASKHQ